MSVNHTVPRKLQAKIHSEKSKNFSVWNSLRADINTKYELATNLDDYGNHLIREFNRKISNYVKNQPSFNDLYITPYDAGFRFLGSTFQGGPVYTETTAYDSANAVILTEASNAIPTSWVAYNTTVSTVTFKTSLTSIGSHAFNYCLGLTSITIPNSVTSIGNNAFQNCENITSLTLGSSVNTIGDYAFNSCYGLTSITIPNSVTSIGSAAFYGCSALATVSMGSGVTSIGMYAFAMSVITSVVFPSNQNLTSTGFYAFNGCNLLTSVTIPSNITTISEGSFKSCGGLLSITIPNSVTSIGSTAFSSTGLTSVTIPNSVTSIGYEAFADCTALASVTIPIGVTSMGFSVFQGCTFLSTINCYTTYTVMNAEYILRFINIPVTVHARISDNTWNGVSTLGSEDEPKSITVIRDLI